MANEFLNFYTVGPNFTFLKILEHSASNLSDDKIFLNFSRLQQDIYFEAQFEKTREISA